MENKLYHAKQIYFDFQCDQNALEMPLVGTGRHCFKCDKVLTDFTGWTGEAIFTFLKDKPVGSVCGFFSKGQIQEDIEIVFEAKYEKLDFTRQFFFVLLFVFGTSLFSLGEAHAQIKDPATQKTEKLIDVKKTDLELNKQIKKTEAELKKTDTKLEKTKKKIEKLKSEIYVTAGVPSYERPEPKPVIVSEESKPLNIPDSLYTYAQTMPQYKGYSLSGYIAGHIHPPTDPREWGEIRSGKVYVRFVVERDGTITNAEIAKSLSPALDAEALRLVKNMPEWSPGTFNNTAVRVSYVLPIKFSLL